MKNIGTDLRAAISDEVTTLCQIWSITPHMRDTLYFTSHDRDIEFGGETWIAAAGFQASTVENTLGGSRGNLDITIMLNSEYITRDDVERGLMIEAEVELFTVDWAHPEHGSIREFKGNVKQVGVPTNLHAVLTLQGNLSRMSRQLTENYTPTCRADFGDARCGINADTFSEEFIVTAGSDLSFTSAELGGEPNGRYKLGSIVWHTGNNTGHAQEVLTNVFFTGEVRLFMIPPFPIEPGDAGIIYRGCAKTVAACQAYNNIRNYRGEPYVPGEDFIYKSQTEPPPPSTELTSYQGKNGNGQV